MFNFGHTVLLQSFWKYCCQVQILFFYHLHFFLKKLTSSLPAAMRWMFTQGEQQVMGMGDQYSHSVDVVMGLVSDTESETGRTAPWCGEGARTGVKWPGTFPTTWPLLFGCRWDTRHSSTAAL